ncbi:MAG: hypothetical protein IJ853_00990 [Rickettsiales bacterium]|nr:hypothetical protein [Rickettsiales bacterium]
MLGTTFAYGFGILHKRQKFPENMF